MSVLTPLPSQVIYPDSDGLPMADNTLQGHWIILLFDNFTALFRDALNVFVAQNLLWYAVEGRPDICAAPDVLLVFGRPKGYRGSYRQWEEDNLPPTVVFEILSPDNSMTEMDRKWLFYEDHGVEEYYIYDPEDNHLQIYVRQGSVLRRVRPADGFTSPRLGVRFDLSGEQLVIWRPDGQRFISFAELDAARAQEVLRTESAEKKAEAAEKRAEDVAQRMKRLAELGRKARHGQATPEELNELEQLEQLPQS